MSDSPGKNRASRLVARPSDDQRPATDEGELAMKIVLISGTGLIGSKSVAILRQGGHEVIAAARDPQAPWSEDREARLSRQPHSTERR